MLIKSCSTSADEGIGRFAPPRRKPLAMLPNTEVAGFMSQLMAKRGVTAFALLSMTAVDGPPA